jgi:hypothetical protein
MTQSDQLIGYYEYKFFLSLGANHLGRRPTANVIDAALTHLIESKTNLNEAREEHDPRTIQAIVNTSVLGLHYRTEIKEKVVLCLLNRVLDLFLFHQLSVGGLR